MTCPNCGQDATGKFCSACGTPLTAAVCANCTAPLIPGARFCNQCGAAVGGPRVGLSRPHGTAVRTIGGGSNTLWYLAAGVLLLIIAILVAPMLLKPEMTPSPAAPFANPGSGSPPPLTGTPRENADRLFNRIAEEREKGDTARARSFTPMAIQAYELAEPLDADGIYHLAAIHIVAEDYRAALSAAERILRDQPNHLLGLGVAAEAASLAGDAAGAKEFYRRFLAAYDAEIARGLDEYQGHSRVLPEIREAARAATR